MADVLFPIDRSVKFPINPRVEFPGKWSARVQFNASVDDVAMLEAYAKATGQKTTTVMRRLLHGLRKDYCALMKKQQGGKR
jgi:hypothetical protein